jgi:3-isopropylmalate dehydrogenase
MLLRHSLGLADEARALEAAVTQALEAGVRTADLKPSGTAATTREAGHAVLARL